MQSFDVLIGEYEAQADMLRDLKAKIQEKLFFPAQLILDKVFDTMAENDAQTQLCFTLFGGLILQYSEFSSLWSFRKLCSLMIVTDISDLKEGVIDFIEKIKDESRRTYHVTRMEDEQALLGFEAALLLLTYDGMELEELEKEYNALHKRSVKMYDVDEFVDVVLHEMDMLIAMESENYDRFFSAFVRACASSAYATTSTESLLEGAVNAMLGGLLSENIFNFRPLIETGVLEMPALQEHPILQLLNGVQDGEIENVSHYISEVSQDQFPALYENETFIIEKARVARFVAICFNVLSRPVREATFDELCDELQFENVLLLKVFIIKCVSLELVTGKLNDIKRVFRIENVKPRVVNAKLVSDLKFHLSKWLVEIDDSMGMLQLYEEQQKLLNLE
ncbi:hypothetical protein PCE1_004491 [Barthelona sp. PCE]